MIFSWVFLFLFRYKTNFIFFYSTADCFLSGERVKISTSSEYHKYEDTFACATVEDNICSNSTEYFDLTFDDGYKDGYRYIDLTACVDKGKWIFINYLNAKCSNIVTNGMPYNNDGQYLISECSNNYQCPAGQLCIGGACGNKLY